MVLNALLQSLLKKDDNKDDKKDDKFGFIVISRRGVLFGTCGNTVEVLLRNEFDIGRVPLRGNRMSMNNEMRISQATENRIGCVRQTAEHAYQLFIDHDTRQPNVAGLILAGPDRLKTDLSELGMLHPSLHSKILNVVDVSYGGEAGFNAAIELSVDILCDVKILKEKDLLEKYFSICQKTEKISYGVDMTMRLLQIGAVETLIVFENLDVFRYVLKNPSTGKLVTRYLKKDEEGDRTKFLDRHTTREVELEIMDKTPLLSWLATVHNRFGCSLEIVSGKCNEGRKFVRGFGGIGGILRYEVHVEDDRGIIGYKVCLEEDGDHEVI